MYLSKSAKQVHLNFANYTSTYLSLEHFSEQNEILKPSTLFVCCMAATVKPSRADGWRSEAAIPSAGFGVVNPKSDNEEGKADLYSEG
ncbi:hypothetical protein L596_000659 [Steinernema carpocapsae]|uniref:Uncharacterized protein n=1 Tax=Steinernema carpocapsae TaxID=34508 RepID=A0A4U8UJ36_STECR|nr:hypothetical protein L596_000659 [Steinernema carpocapsae]